VSSGFPIHGAIKYCTVDVAAFVVKMMIFSFNTYLCLAVGNVTPLPSAFSNCGPGGCDLVPNSWSAVE
jgi:hypothetical protein